MKNNYCATKKHSNHLTFGGRIYNSDFDGYKSMSDVASRIISDWKFDEQLRKNSENRDRKQIIKGENNEIKI